MKWSLNQPQNEFEMKWSLSSAPERTERLVSFSACPVSSACNNINLQKLPYDLDRLDSCKTIKELKQIHASVIKTRPPQTQIILRKIISLCALLPFGDLDHALSLLPQIENPNLYLYNKIMQGFSRSKNNPLQSLFLYREMLENGFEPDNHTIPFLLKACTRSNAFREGKTIHAQSIKSGLVRDVYVKNTLMRLYGTHGQMDDAQKLFDGSPRRDLVTWATLIQGYTEVGFHLKAISVFLEMVEAKFVADEVIMVIVLSACSKLGDLNLGRKIHKYMLDNKVNSDVFVGNALVDMYLKCKDVDSAQKCFKAMPVKNVVSWNSMISGMVQLGKFKEALLIFRKMVNRGVEPDGFTLVGVINSCANLGAIELGKWIHASVGKKRIKLDRFIGNALVDMYAKCGSIDEAFQVFESIECKDVYSYTTMIVGLALHGHGEEALALFAEMSRIGIKPNEVTFVGVLSACNHMGLVEEGHRHFEEMLSLHKLRPQMEHYGCMVDLLGRAGHIHEAEEFIKAMPIEPDALVWGALMGACRIHGKVEVGESIMKRLIDMDPKEDGAHVLMSNLYSSANRWKDALQIRKAMKDGNVKKTPGCSLIVLDGLAHEFRKGDKSHPKTEDIYKMLKKIMCSLRNEGSPSRRNCATMEEVESFWA